ncbi:hypothetical protein B5S31_g1077 [[Candida] boidinii]|nr:hypothetical protein B5S31_g1077 [[Candida] boidinii]
MTNFDINSLPSYDPEIERRVCFITGGNSGIGYYTALNLYMKGYIVYIASRSKQRMERAINDIREEAIRRRLKLSSSSTSTTTSLGELFYIEIDLLNLNSIELAVKEFKSRENSLHLLIDNAGIMAVPFKLTKDNFEVQIQTNYISHVLLNDRLIELMLKDSVINPRIVLLSSIGHWLLPIKLSLNYQFNHYKPNLLFSWFRYALAKTTGIQYMKILSKKYPKILCLSVHPGFVMNTNLFSHFTRLPIIGLFFWSCFQFFGWVFGVTNEEGSYSTLKCALDPSLNSQNDNGKYFTTFGIESKPSGYVLDEKYALENWNWTVDELAKRGHPVDL